MLINKEPGVKFWQRYSEVLAIMEIAFGVDDFHKSSFSARLSYLRRPEIGCVPMAIQEGKNKLTFYSESALKHIFLAMVLSFQLGIDPKHIGKLYQSKISRLNRKSNKGEIVPEFYVDEWFARGEENVSNALLDSMKLQISYGPSVNKKYKPFSVMFRASPGLGEKNYMLTSLWPEVDFDKLKKGATLNPCSFYLDFTYLAAWLKLAIREWEKKVQED